jgi:type IV pilus assembly protein PilF
VKTFNRIWAGVVVCLLATSCISTTTGEPEEDPDPVEAAQLNYQLGARYYRSGKYEIARDRLQLAIQLNPRMAIAYSTLGLVYESLGNPRLATEAYEEAVHLAPRDHDVQNTYAVFLCRQREFDDAADHFKRAAEMSDNDDQQVTLTNAGVCMAQKPDLVQAESFFRRALEVSPNYGEALLQMCVLKHEMNENLIARAFLQRFLSANKAAPDVLYLGVEIEQALGDERAQEDLSNQILREFPESAEARRIMDAG